MVVIYRGCEAHFYWAACCKADQRLIKFSLASRLSPKKKKRRTHNPEDFAYPVLMRPSVASGEKSFLFPAKVVG